MIFNLLYRNKSQNLYNSIDEIKKYLFQLEKKG